MSSSYRFIKITTAVTISKHLLSASAAAGPSLDSFREAANKGASLYVSHDGCEWQVLATGTMPDERSVAEAGPGADSQSAFIGALGRVFSAGIQAAVVRDLGLAPAPGQPLASGLVQQAIAMAKTSQQAMLGVDFMTRFMCSAVTRSGGFTAACRAEGRPLEAVSGLECEAIDAAMQRRFAQAASQGKAPVPLALAQQWLQFELLASIGQAPSSR